MLLPLEPTSTRSLGGGEQMTVQGFLPMSKGMLGVHTQVCACARVHVYVRVCVCPRTRIQ